MPGNTVKLAIVAKEPIKDVKVAIKGQEAAVSSTDNINWTATATLNQGVDSGPVKFTINYNKQDGTEGYPATQTTDNTSLYLVDESDVIKNVTSIANLIDSTSGRSAATTLQQVNACSTAMQARVRISVLEATTPVTEATLSLTLRRQSSYANECRTARKTRSKFCTESMVQ